MSNYFRKNQRKLLAVFGVLLMITFVVSLGQNNGPSGGGRGDPVVGTWTGGEIHNSEYLRAQREWEQLTTKIHFPKEDRYVPVAAILGLDTYRRIDAITFLLLLKDAQRMNIKAPPKDVSDLAKQVVLSDDPEIREFQLQAIADLKTVQVSVFALMNTIKISDPAAIHRASADAAMLSVNLIDFNADQFKSDHPTTAPATSPATTTASATTVPATTAPTGPITLVASRATTFPTLIEASSPTPTPQEATLYSKFKDVEPDKIDYTADPFGFAYKYPNRIKYDNIFISYDSIDSQIVVPELALLREFRDHPTDYPATQPTTIPSSTQAATTGPATRDVATSAPSAPTTKGSRPTVFNDVRKDIEKKLKEQFTRKVAEEIRKDMGSSRVDLQACKLEYSIVSPK